ncbi:MAG: hypothetical protein RLY70_3783 [Planctomycetota bacterium]
MAAADEKEAEFPEALTLPMAMVPLVTVDAVMLPPIAVTLASVKSPLVADNVMAPLVVVADVTVSPPDVSPTLMMPAEPTAAVNPVVALISRASLDVPMPESADNEMAVPDKSASESDPDSVIAPTDVKVTEVPAATLPT